MVIQHGGDVLIGKQYENSRCSVQPNELLVSTQPLVSQFEISHFNHHEHYVLQEASKKKHLRLSKALRAVAGHRPFLESPRNRRFRLATRRKKYSRFKTVRYSSIHKRGVSFAQKYIRIYYPTKYLQDSTLH